MRRYYVFSHKISPSLFFLRMIRDISTGQLNRTGILDGPTRRLLYPRMFRYCHSPVAVTRYSNRRCTGQREQSLCHHQPDITCSCFKCPFPCHGREGEESLPLTSQFFFPSAPAGTVVFLPAEEGLVHGLGRRRRQRPGRASLSGCRRPGNGSLASDCSRSDTRWTSGRRSDFHRECP